MSEEIKDKFDFTEDIEDVLCSSFLQNRKIWIDFKDHIDSIFFKNELNSKFFNILTAFFKKYKDYPSLEQTIDIAIKKWNNDKLKEKIKKIYSYRELKIQELDYLHDECYHFIKNHKIKKAILESVELLEQRKFDDIETKMKEATQWNADIDLGTRIDDIENRFVELEELITGVIPSPWQALNLLIGGGFYRKELTLFAGSSSVGKSICLDNIAFHSWLNGFNVVEITLELSELRKCQRIDAALMQIPMSDVLSNKEGIIKYYQDNKRENRLYIKEFPTSRISVTQIYQYLHQLELYEGLHHPDLLIVDYLDIMRPAQFRTGNTYTDQGTVTEDLRALAQDLDFPLVSGSQFSRANLNMPIEELTEGALADSWRKMWGADTLLGVANTPEERIAGRINFKTLKGRNGPKDIIIPLRVFYDQMRITDIRRQH